MHNIQVREHGKVSVPESVVGAVPADFWKGADCTVSRSGLHDEWTLKAGNNVGVARIRTPAADVVLQVKPKLDTADIFLMADYAYGQRHDPLVLLDRDDVGLEAVLRDPTACLLVWHARSIRQFAARWLRRDYQTRAQVLDGKVKGKILVGRYVSAHLAVGDAARIPCRVQERTQDTANNRLLKAGLRYIAAMSHNLPVPAARRAVLQQVNAALPLFAYVSDIRVSPSDIRATSTRGPQRHYAAVLKATIGLLQNRLMGDETSTDASTFSFMWRMPVLFQEAVRGILDSSDGLVLADEKPGTARIYDSDGKRRTSSKVDPDLVLHASHGRTLVIDTKYKNALPPGMIAEDDDVTVGARNHIKISRSDVYQVVAYRQHERWTNSTVALLYPVVLDVGEPLPSQMRVTGFGEAVALLFIDIGKGAARNLPAFLDSVRRLAEPPGDAGAPALRLAP